MPEASVIDKIPEFLRRGPVIGAAGAATGAALGRYLAAPLLRALGFEDERSKRALTILGALAGAVPGAVVSAGMHRAGRGWTAPMNAPPADAAQQLQDWNLEQRLGRPFALQKLGAFDPLGVIRAQENLWKPTFGVSSALDTISSNAIADPVEKVQQMQLVARAGQEQGTGWTGLASPGALMAALPQVVSNAIPTVGGAMLVSKILGAPSWARKGAVGGALAYSALKSFMG